MKKIIKVVFEDGTEMTQGEFQPFTVVEGDDSKEIWKKQRAYLHQFRKFEEEILEHLTDDVVEEYARDTFDLIEEDECDCPKGKRLEDCDDDELISEVDSRRIYGYFHKSIVSEDFLVRFSKITEKENHIIIDELLTGLERKLNL